MRQLRTFVTPLHVASKRDYIARMVPAKPAWMTTASQYGFDYWDGERQFGYGGYRYMPGRWRPVAAALIDTYQLGPGSRVLDVGCGKGFLLYEMQQLQPALDIHGLDVSDYALAHMHPDLKATLHRQRAEEAYPYPDKHFDLVISLGCLHNLEVGPLAQALAEMERVGRQGYTLVESYRNDQELFNLECWALTCRAFHSPDAWKWVFDHFGYSGDFEFIFFE
jgi:SAM-dependent methyltransferase